MVTRSIVALSVIIVATTFSTAPSALAALSIGVGTAPTLSPQLKAGQTSTATGTLTVSISLPDLNWTLFARDANATNPGHLLRAGACSGGAISLAAPLSLTATPVLGTSAGAKSLSGSQQQVASGTLISAVNMSYSQAVGAAEALMGGCSYSATVTFTLS